MSGWMRGRPARFWAFTGVGLTALGLVVLAAPASAEGPVLIPVSPGHGLSALDTAGLVPLLAGVTLPEWLGWRERGRLAAGMARRPGIGGLVTFAAGTGLGLLLGSVLSNLAWLWAVGAALLAAAAAGLVWLSLDRT